MSAGEVRADLVFGCDLDRTLIYSAAALALGGTEPDDLRCVEHYRGEPLSYLTGAAARLLTALTTDRPGGALLVPATTRTRAQYARVRLPGPPPPYAICANGGHILVDGEPDPDWHARIRRRLAEAAPLAEITDRLRRAGEGGDWLLRTHTADDLFAYLIVDRERLPDTWLKELTAWAEPLGWQISLQGRKVYAVPHAVTKGAALTEVARRTGATRSCAAGDSLLDADLLLAARTGWHPAHGELADTGWTAPHITALPERGAAAGERILREATALAVGR